MAHDTKTRYTKEWPCRQPGYRPVYARRVIPGRNDGYIVPTHVLAPVLREQIRLLSAEGGKYVKEGEGGIEILSRRAAVMFKRSDERYHRRIYDILHEKSRTVNIDLADELLLACDLSIVGDTDIPILPAGLTAAKERIQARCEMQDFDLDPAQVAEMAEDYMEFVLTIVHDTHSTVTELPQATEPVLVEAA